jgi:hypothetical protein
VRNAGSKAKYAPPAGKGHWFWLDEIAIATIQSPPAAFEGMNAAAFQSVFPAIATPLIARLKRRIFPGLESH